MRLACALILVAVSCGGSKGEAVEPSPPPGEEHDTPPPASEPDAGGLAPATQPTDGGAMMPPPVEGGTTILIRNEGSSELNFGVTKGWGLLIFGYTGKPPKAKSVTLFPPACSASCDSPPEAICPVCPVPKTKKEEQAMARTETAPPGGTLSVPWDGKLLTFEKAAGKKCKCWRTQEAAADTYTIKGCGLRPPEIPGKPSKPVCAETQVTLGPGEAPPAEIVLVFK